MTSRGVVPLTYTKNVSAFTNTCLNSINSNRFFFSVSSLTLTSFMPISNSSNWDYTTTILYYVTGFWVKGFFHTHLILWSWRTLVQQDKRLNFLSISHVMGWKNFKSLVFLDLKTWVIKVGNLDVWEDQLLFKNPVTYITTVYIHTYFWHLLAKLSHTTVFYTLMCIYLAMP